MLSEIQKDLENNLYIRHKLKNKEINMPQKLNPCFF